MSRTVHKHVCLLLTNEDRFSAIFLSLDRDGHITVTVLARLFHVSNNSVIDSILCYFTGILPPRYQIDQACMKYIIGLSKNPSANLVQDVLFCVHRNRCNVLFAKYSASVFSHIGDVAKAV